MKKVLLVLASVLTLAASVAQADSIQLNMIDTNFCERARNEVSVLSSAQVPVIATCSPYGYYRSDDGRVFNYRVYTTVEVPGPVYQGQSIQLNFIDTNDCYRAQREIMLLNSAQVQVSAVCSDYVFQGYRSDNGRLYNYRLYTTITLR
jgi:predicted aconitase